MEATGWATRKSLHELETAAAVAAILTGWLVRLPHQQQQRAELGMNAGTRVCFGTHTLRLAQSLLRRTASQRRRKDIRIVVIVEGTEREWALRWLVCARLDHCTGNICARFLQQPAHRQQRRSPDPTILSRSLLFSSSVGCVRASRYIGAAKRGSSSSSSSSGGRRFVTFECPN